MITRLILACSFTMAFGSAHAQGQPSARMYRFEAEQLVKGYGAHIADLNDDVERYRFRELFAADATHEFDFPGFGDQDIFLPIERYIEAFSAINATTVILAPTEFTAEGSGALRAKKKSTYTRTTPCEANSNAAFSEIDVVFSFTQTADGLRIARVQAFGNPSTTGRVGSSEVRRPGMSTDRLTLPSYLGMVRLESDDTWWSFDEFLEQPEGRSTASFTPPSGIRVCVPETSSDATDDWSGFLARWQHCDEPEARGWTFISWRDEVQINGNIHMLGRDGWSADLLPSEFESNGGFSCGLKYSMWMPTKAQNWNWGIRTSINFLALEATSKWDNASWETATIDPDGMPYRRLTTASGLTENLSVTSVHVDFGGGIERRIGHWGPFLFSELGVGLFHPIRIKSASQSTIYHAGYYPSFHGVTIDHPEVYDFGYHTGIGSQVLTGRSALYASGLLGMRYIWQASKSFAPTLSIGFGLNQTLSDWFDSESSNWVKETDEVISPTSTDASSSILSRYLHLGLGIPVFTPDCID